MIMVYSIWKSEFQCAIGTIALAILTIIGKTADSRSRICLHAQEWSYTVWARDHIRIFYLDFCSVVQSLLFRWKYILLFIRKSKHPTVWRKSGENQKVFQIQWSWPVLDAMLSAYVGGGWPTVFYRVSHLPEHFMFPSTERFMWMQIFFSPPEVCFYPQSQNCYQMVFWPCC